MEQEEEGTEVGRQGQIPKEHNQPVEEVPVERCSDLRDHFKTVKIQMAAKYLMLLSYMMQKSRLAQLAACPHQQIFPKVYPQ